MKTLLGLIICLLAVCLSGYGKPGGFNPYTTGSTEEIRGNLYTTLGGSSTLLDGNLTQYAPTYTNSLDGMDAMKMSNSSENLGMIRNAITLVIERRTTITADDTIFYKIWHVQQRPYQLEFLTVNMNHQGLQGFLEDGYLKTSTPIDLNGRSTFDFSVTADPASAAMYRFRVVFKSLATAVLPLTVTSVKAYPQYDGVAIDWSTENERSIRDYQVQKSTDGGNFSGVYKVPAENLTRNHYSWTDPYPAKGYNYYRVMATDNTGTVRYSEVVKAVSSRIRAGFRVYPNPATNKTLQLEFDNERPGEYVVRLIDPSGKVILYQQTRYAGGKSVVRLQTNHEPGNGVYQVEVIQPDGTIMTQQVVY